jgi:hypothetical protein
MSNRSSQAFAQAFPIAGLRFPGNPLVHGQESLDKRRPSAKAAPAGLACRHLCVICYMCS